MKRPTVKRPTRRGVIIGFSTVALILGVVLVLLGVVLVYPPAAIILAGGALIAAVWFTNIE